MQRIAFLAHCDCGMVTQSLRALYNFVAGLVARRGAVRFLHPKNGK
ncbi:hypothetical protein HMPREF1861_01964 [Corynebacterium kroppenstedtii]|nr:hypothetical protein HMPREF1861_01964 [Corynebacterium kroppenstedtii]